MSATLIKGDCLSVLPTLGQFDCVFADPPDNIGLDYDEHADDAPDEEYLDWLEAVLFDLTKHSPIIWVSFNARWTAEFGASVLRVTGSVGAQQNWTYKPCVQVFTFGQHSHTWLGNNHRPLWCIYRKDAQFYPDAIRVPSWRQRNGDKRADPRGRVPGDVFDMQYGEYSWRGQHFVHTGDVFDFPRVTGNNKQRCDWHPTQLHEELVERVIKFSTADGGSVLDPFAGTGTTLRVCKRLNRNCTTIDMDGGYCQRIAESNGLSPAGECLWLSA
jgi:DNA modification methylase